MSIRRPFAIEVGQAFRLRMEEERSTALHALVHGLLSAGALKLKPADQDRLVSEYGAAHRLLREQSARCRLTEIDLTLFANAQQRDKSICAFAIIFDMPIELAERCILFEDPGLLLLACRSENFAWSTLSALIALDPRHMHDELFLIQCSEDYHMISMADARRFMRLLRVNLVNRSSAYTETAAASLRMNVR